MRANDVIGGITERKIIGTSLKIDREGEQSCASYASVIDVIMIDSRNDTPSMWALAPYARLVALEFSLPVSVALASKSLDGNGTTWAPVPFTSA